MSNENEWIDALFEVAPYRFTEGTNLSSILFLIGLLMEANDYATYDISNLRNTKENSNPDDVLGRISEDYGTPRYGGETAAAHRVRINNKWSILPTYGQENALVTELKNSLDATSVTVNYTLVGFEGTYPSVSGNPIYDIPGYPNSYDYISQFNVSIYWSSVPSIGGTESNILTDEQMRTARQLIRLIKPADWVCREILLYVNDGSGTFWDGGVDWDGSVDWDSISSTIIAERHRAVL